MKRHPGLQNLSRAHHHGLVQARALRRAAAGEAGEGAVLAFLEAWQQEITPHFRQEEEVLLPAYARYADPGTEAVPKLLVQHIHLRRLVEDLICQMTTGSPQSQTLRDLGEQLEAHIRHEEQVVFPAIEAALPEAVLEDLGTRLLPIRPPSESTLPDSVPGEISSF